MNYSNSTHLASPTAFDAGCSCGPVPGLDFQSGGIGAWAAALGWGIQLAAGLVLGAAFAADREAPQSDSHPGALTVAAVVDEVVQRNPELDFYRAEITAAAAGRRTSAQWQNPELSADIGSKRVWERGGAALGDGMAWSVSVAQTFEFPGRIGLRKAIANRQVDLAELGLAQFQASLAARARGKALAALAAQEKLDAANEVTQRLRALLATLVQRDPAGVTPLLDQRIIEASSITLQRRAAQAARELQGALLELNQLRGAPAGAPLRLTGSLDAPTNVPALSALLDVAATNSFDLRMRQTELAQQGFQVQLARNERYPKVTLAPFYASERANDEQHIVGVGVSLPLPLWNQNRGGIEAAYAREQQAAASLRVAQREVERRVTDHALALETQLAEMAQWRPDAAAQFREAAELADRHFRLGAVPVTIYVEMQMKYLDALEVLLATRHEALEHWQQLEVLVGRPLASLSAP
jgi:cobalt-zinc-cadmium efflux system outer membrane protein